MAIKIMLDAGHEGKENQSTVIPAYFESDMNWKLHLFLRKELENFGFKVDITRETQDEELEITERGRKAKGYDLFLSIHSNAAPRESADHALVIYSYENLNNAEILAKNLTIAISSVMKLKEECIIGTRKHLFEHGVDEYYGVLRGAKSVDCPLFYILEHSFHTNIAATKWLLNDDNLKKLAVHEAETIAAYYNIPKPTSNAQILGEMNLSELNTIIFTEDHIDHTDADDEGKLPSKDHLMVKRAMVKTLEL